MNEISVLVTCYREGKLIRRAIESLDQQTDKDFETIVINDASPDPLTNKICQELEAGRKAKVIWCDENKGEGGARNIGHEAMKGEICIQLDADDILPPRTVALVRQAFKENPEIDFIFGDYIRCEVEKETRELVDMSVLSDANGFLDPRQLVQKYSFLGCAPHRKSAWSKIQGYACNGTAAVDIDFWYRIFLSGSKGKYINRTLYEWHRSERGYNANFTRENICDVDLKNIALFDRFADGISKRKKLIRFYLREGKFDKVKMIAQQLVDLGHRDPRIVLLSKIPIQILRLLGRFIK